MRTRHCAPAWRTALALAIACGGASAAADDLASRYAKASEFLPWTLKDRIHGPAVSDTPAGLRLQLEVQWQADGRSFRYEEHRRDGIAYYRVDPAKASRTMSSPPPREAQAAVSGTSLSPNGRWMIRLVDGNLFVGSPADGANRQLTFDAVPDYAYGFPPSDLGSLGRRRTGELPPVQGVWSPDGNRFLSCRVDERGAYQMPFLVNTAPGQPHQLPWVHLQNTYLPGSDVPRFECAVFDADSGHRVAIKAPGAMDLLYYTRLLEWSPDGRTVFTSHESRDFREITLYASDTTTGEARIVAKDVAELPLRGSRRSSRQALPVGNGKEIVLYSERDGWPHYYLYDGVSGALKNQITRGDWAVHDMLRVDERERWLYFTAGGREPGRDPYYSHLYRARLDGSAIELLTPEVAQHDIQFAPAGGYFIDTYSTVADPPVMLLRASNGRKIMELLRTDIDEVRALGWIPPRRVRFIANDGKTELYGTYFPPIDASADEPAPILDFIYGGPQHAYAPRRFMEGIGTSLATTYLGIGVLIVDARGTPLRSRKFQDLSFGKGFGSMEISADHVAAIRQLAAADPSLDVERVGIAGISWGGYWTARAMFQHPKFFKAGIAIAGSHDNFVYPYHHDRWFGLEKEWPGTYLEQSNLPLAGRLEGSLLLAHGGADGSVHVAHTLQLAAAMIRENKDFDLLILPDRGHGDLSGDGYFIRRNWDFLVRHLLSREPPRHVQVPSRPN